LNIRRQRKGLGPGYVHSVYAFLSHFRVRKYQRLSHPTVRLKPRVSCSNPEPPQQPDPHSPFVSFASFCSNCLRDRCPPKRELLPRTQNRPNNQPCFPPLFPLLPSVQIVFETAARPIASFSQEPRTVPTTNPVFPLCFLCCLLFKLSLRPLPAQARASPKNPEPSQQSNLFSPFVSFASFCSNCP
jgi:hypothetical protein